jgi:large subunit ribosomal protein L20
MPRARKGAARHRARNRVLKEAKGRRVGRGTLYRLAKEAGRRASNYRYRDRRTKKRLFRSLWIVRLNAACRARGLTYSRFIDALAKENIDLNRQALAAMAVDDPAAFDQLAELAKKRLTG